MVGGWVVLVHYLIFEVLIMSKSNFVAGVAAVALTLCPLAAFAEGTTAVDQLKTEAAKVSGIYDDVVPVAVGSIVFSIGAIIIKRVAFS